LSNIYLIFVVIFEPPGAFPRLKTNNNNNVTSQTSTEF